jgi:hypothetical protein
MRSANGGSESLVVDAKKSFCFKTPPPLLRSDQLLALRK